MAVLVSKLAPILVVLTGALSSLVIPQTTGHSEIGLIGNETARAISSSNFTETPVKLLGTEQLDIHMDSNPERGGAESTTGPSLLLLLVFVGAPLVLLPLVLLPLVFLYARTGAQLETKDSELRPLAEPLILKPTMPGNDIFLGDRSAWGPEDAQAVKLEESTGQPQYHLLPSATLFSPQTGQLYHPSTGLLFNPIGNQKFDPYLGKVITENGLLPAHPNLVYLPPTNSTSAEPCWLYERCLSISFGPPGSNQTGLLDDSSADQSGAKWCLAKSPKIQSDNRSAIRRVRAEELPESLMPRYSMLLAEWQQIHSPKFTKPGSQAVVLPPNEPSLDLATPQEMETTIYQDACSPFIG